MSYPSPVYYVVSLVVYRVTICKTRDIYIRRRLKGATGRGLLLNIQGPSCIIGRWNCKFKLGVVDASIWRAHEARSFPVPAYVLTDINLLGVDRLSSEMVEARRDSRCAVWRRYPCLGAAHGVLTAHLKSN